MEQIVHPTQKDIIERMAEQAVPPIKKTYTPEEFVNLYNRLCAETGYQIGAFPVFKLRDDGTYSVIVSANVERLPVKSA